jgi:hypothetical protein
LVGFEFLSVGQDDSRSFLAVGGETDPGYGGVVSEGGSVLCGDGFERGDDLVETSDWIPDPLIVFDGGFSETDRGVGSDDG